MPSLDGGFHSGTALGNMKELDESRGTLREGEWIVLPKSWHTFYFLVTPTCGWSLALEQVIFDIIASVVTLELHSSAIQDLTEPAHESHIGGLYLSVTYCKAPTALGTIYTQPLRWSLRTNSSKRSSASHPKSRTTTLQTSSDIYTYSRSTR